MSSRRFIAASAMGMVLAASLLLSGCASEYVKVAPRPPDNYEKLARTSGTACGSLLIYATAWNFIPVLLNERIERAYAAALADVPGATALVDVSYEEFWFWWGLGHTKCLTISGEAIR